MNHATKIANIDTIQLTHMKIDLDAHEIIIEEGKLAGKALAVVLVQAYYRKFVADIEKVTKVPIREGHGGRKDRSLALAHAKWFATKRTLELPDVIQETTVHLLQDASKTGWHHTVGENDSIGELLASMLDSTPENTSTFYDLQFLIDTLIPLMRNLDFTETKIGVATMAVQKMRVMIPAARKLLKDHKEGNTTDTKLKKELTWLVDLALDNTKAREQKKKMFDKYRGKQIIEELDGYVYMLEKNRSLLVVEVTDDEQNMIEMALRNRVTFRISDIATLLKSIPPKTKKK